MVTLFSYKVFIATVEHMNFRRAADELSLTPSAVSHCIGNMEEELGFPLFIRKKNKITLTSNAEYMIPYVRQLINSENVLNQAADEIKGFQRGGVRLGCFNSVCIRWIPELVRDFKALYPGIEIELFQGSYEDIVKWLEDGSIDIGFLSASSAGDIPITPLYKDQLMAVVPKGFKTLNSNFIKLSELADCQFVQPLENCDADSQKLFKDYGLQSRSHCHVIDDVSTMSMVEAGFGVCILPKMLTDSFSLNVDVYPLEPETYRIIGVSCHENLINIPAVHRLYQLILDKYKSE